MKRYATTIVLLIAAIGLGVWLWRDRNHVTSTERQDRANDVFPAWRREDLSRVEIAHEGETIVLVKETATDSPWKMTSPRHERVDQAAVERMTTTLEFATRVRKVAQGDALGFATPRASGSVVMGALQFHFVLGGVSPRPEGSGYLKVDNGDPFVASKELTDALLASADAYRDRTVIPYLSMEMARFEVIHPAGGFVVKRKDDRSFEIPALGVFASRNALDKVWSALAEMRAETFPKDADVDRLTANPRLTIKIAPSDARKPAGELVVGDACPGHPDDVVVLRKLPTRVAACAPRGAMDQLTEITPQLLVDHRPFAFRHDEIEELKLEALASPGDGPEVIEVARRGTGFHLRAPEDRELRADEAEAVSDEIAAIGKLEALEVTKESAPFKAVARARVWAGGIEEAVEVGDVNGATVAVHRMRDDARLTFTRASGRLLVPRLVTLRPLALLNDPRKVTRILLRCGVDQELVDSGSGFRLVTPKGYETDGTITQLVDGLTRGKVLSWTADRDDGTFGIAGGKSPLCNVIVGFADGNMPATILFGGKAEGGGIYGTIDGKLGVFVAPAALRELAERIYVSRGSLRVDPGAIEKVTVIVGGKTITADPSSTEEQARLRDAVGAFYAERAISLESNMFWVQPELEIRITETDAGSPKLIKCYAESPDRPGLRRCVTPEVKAIFEVSAATIARVLGSPADAGVATVTDAGGVDAR